MIEAAGTTEAAAADRAPAVRAWRGDAAAGAPIDRWLALRAQLAAAYPNNDPGRFLATARAIPDAEPVVIESEGGLLLGRLARRRGALQLGFASVPGPRLMTLDIVRGGALFANVEDESVRAAIDEAWRLGARRLVWHALPEGSPLLGAISRAGAVAERKSERRHWLRIDDRADNPIAHCSSKTRSKIRRYSRKLDKDYPDAVRMEIIEEPSQVEGFCRACEEISQNSYHSMIGYGVRNNELWRASLTAAAEAGRLRSYLLFLEDRPVAYQNGSVDGQTYCSDGKGFDRSLSRERPGTVLLYRALEDLFERGVREVDFGVGDSGYKDVFGNATTTELRVTLYRPGLASAPVTLGARAAGWIGRAARWASGTRLGRAARARIVRSSGDDDS